MVTVSGDILTSDDAPRAPTESARPTENPPDRNALRFVPGLDGLRGVAVLAVMGFHAGLGPVSGGLLGVDMFFVLSGFLVTSLLLSEHARTGTIRLLAFWGRRARRLLPALFVLLIGIGAYARWVGGGVPPAQLRGDALFTLGYAANWHFIASGQNYFVRFGAPSPLLHTWSLAVEEQFYLVWPIIVLVMLRRFGPRGVGWAAAVIGSASAALCAGLYLTGASIDRLYYGTDTRAQSIMVGAVLAVLVPMTARPAGAGLAQPSREPESERAPPPWWYPNRPRRIAGLGLIGALALLWALHAVRGDGALLYEGGFLLVALCTAAVIASTVELPRAALTRALCFRPLRYTGRISYGLYLYHWPLFLVLDGARTGLTGAALLTVRLGATFGVAALSYRFVELPVPRLATVRRAAPRRAGLVRSFGRLRRAGGGGPPHCHCHPRRGGAPDREPPPAHFIGPAGVDAAHPEHALLLGDSLALTLGIGLGDQSRAWGITIDNKSAIGCDLDPGTTVDVMGTVSPAAGGCPDWRASWTGLVDRERPDVVVVLLGRWECLDRLWGGRWTHVGESAFDRHLVAELGQVIDIGSAHGAKVALLTLPYIAQTTEQPDGSPWDMNLPSRTDAYNADVRRAVAEHPHQATVIDLNKLLDPGGHYTSYIRGVRVRSYDDEHISTAGGQLLRATLLPELVHLGLPTYRADLGRAP